MRLLLIIALLVALVVAALIILGPSRPRVTHIERRRERIDEEKDRDDA